MKYWMLAFCLCGFVMVGCGSSQPSNIAGDADAEALAEYEAAIAEADAMDASAPDFKE